MASATEQPSPAKPLSAVSGVQLAQGIGVQEAKGFWADAWESVIKRPAAKFAIVWLGIIAFFAVIAPFIASGHPIVYRELDEAGNVVKTSYPLFRNLSAGDVSLALGALLGLGWMAIARRIPRSDRLLTLLMCSVVVALTLVICTLVFSQLRSSDDRSTRELPTSLLGFRVPLALAVAAVIGAFVAWLLPLKAVSLRVACVTIAGLLAVFSIAGWWRKPLQTFPYVEAIQAKQAEGVFTIIPFSPNQRDIKGDFVPPGTASGLTKADVKDKVPNPPGVARHLAGTDSYGQDVLSQLLHACRLSISIGLVSTGIAVVIGVTIGAMMGYFGGWIDLLLFRVVEIFMALPVLFLLIVAAAVLPRNTYVMMAIIGCVTWTGAARFTRAEFLRLRNQDFVQAAKAVGLPLRSVLFKHMLPNGVTPVLVDASFAVAAAILFEAALSFLGLGPEEQASWGRLLSDATGKSGQFNWWLAIFPGIIIFLTVLSYNLLGEATRDAIDPKLKKARV
ncbi:MAG TPA: ABC transporter permease [Phycisphaerales bacterium]|nr:ABC transporter permease [Phycisphaerales bacterium]